MDEEEEKKNLTLSTLGPGLREPAVAGAAAALAPTLNRGPAEESPGVYHVRLPKKSDRRL